MDKEKEVWKNQVLLVSEHPSRRQQKRERRALSLGHMHGDRNHGSGQCGAGSGTCSSSSLTFSFSSLVGKKKMRKTQPMSQGCPCHGPGTGHFTDIFRLDPVPVKPGAWCSAHSGCHYAPAELSFLPMPSLCCPKRQLPPSASFWPCLLFNPIILTQHNALPHPALPSK